MYTFDYKFNIKLQQNIKLTRCVCESQNAPSLIMTKVTRTQYKDLVTRNAHVQYVNSYIYHFVTCMNNIFIQNNMSNDKVKRFSTNKKILFM